MSARILLVEDDIEVRLVMEHMLVDGGYEVETTGTVEGGCGLIGCREYDLVIVDGRLSDGHGMQVADKAREKGIEALIVTGYAFTLPPEQLDQYTFLMKPLRGAELLESVQRAIAKHSGR